MSGRIRIALVLALAAALLVITAVGVAAATAERYQFTDYVLSVDSINRRPELTHTFYIRHNPCDNSFSGWGIAHHENDGMESLSLFDLTGSKLSFQADYDFADYVWFPSFTLNGGGTLTFHDGHGGEDDNVDEATGTWSSSKTDYKNHGQYVAQTGDATSCIGRPVNSTP